MKTYIINYDLRQQRNYQALHDAIRSYSAWSHVLESAWAVKSNGTAVQVRDNLIQYIDQDDGLFVISDTGEAAWFGLTNQVSTWLKQNIGHG